MFNEKTLNEFIETYGKFMSETERILKTMELIKNGEDFRGCIESIEMNPNDIDVITYEDAGCSCCSGERYYYTIPLSYYYEDFESKLRKKIEDKKEKVRLKNEEDERLRRIQQEENERKKYEELKRKFEDK